MSRYLFTLLLFFATTAFLPAQDRPNIIFLLADDQTFDSLGCYGNPDVKTPSVDQLAAEGLTFDHYYNTTAICMASRANILTGMYEYKTGCNFNKGDLTQEIFAKSYPVLLREAGYVTAFAGKIGIEVEGVGLPEDSFDWWGAGKGQTSYVTKKNKSMVKYAEKYPHSSRSYGAFGADFVKWAVGEGSPFCLSISFKAPHRPVDPDPMFDHVYADTTFRKPENYGRENGLHFAEQSRRGRQYTRFESWGYKDNFNETLKKYHQQIHGVDYAVGMIREGIKEAGVENNTVIFYTSDNGFFNGAHGYGSKVLPYEESVRAPMVFHHPGAPESHGKRTSSLAGNIDVAPTIMELAGIKPPENVDGSSLLPLLKDQAETVHDHLAIMNCWGPQQTHTLGVLTDRFKYIYWYFDDKDMDPAEELYDLKNDRGELKNTVKDVEKSSVLKTMRAHYDSYVSHIGESAQRDAYKAYSTLFDRNQSWDKKQDLLPKRLTPAGK